MSPFVAKAAGGAREMSPFVAEAAGGAQEMSPFRVGGSPRSEEQVLMIGSKVETIIVEGVE